MGLFDAIGNVASTIIGGAMQRSENKRAYERDVAMWNEQNAYNTPAAQMERLKVAGLNPMLVYGNGSVVGNTATGSPKYQPVDYAGISKNVGDAIGSAFDRSLAKKKVDQAEKKLNQDIQLGQAQIDQVKANTAAAVQSILNMEANTKKINAETDSVLYNLGLAKQRGVRDSSLTTFEVGSSYGRKLKGLARDVIKGHPSGNNSVYDQIRRFFE